MGGFAPTGGIETFCKNLLSYFQSNQYNCQLVCWGILSPLISTIKDQNIIITRSFWRWGCRWNLPDWLLLPLGIPSIKKSDVVILGKLFPYPILKILRSQSNSKTKFVYITPYKPSIPDELDKKNISDSLNIFDLIIVQSQSFIENLQHSGYNGNIEILPYINENQGRIKLLPSIESLQIGFLGRLVEDKNIPLLLKSFQYLLQNRYLINDIPATLNLFGDGFLRSSLEELAHELEITDFVVFHGTIPYSQISNSIASCHVFVFTSTNEGQCLAALEILSCGRPIIATSAGALPEILSDSRLGKLVEFTPEIIAMQILEIANLLKQDIMTPENIRSAYLERYDSQKVGDRYIKIINSLE